MDFIASLAEKIIYTGFSLYIYLLNKCLGPFLVSSFAVYLEAVGCDLKFLEDIKAINVNNRTLVNELTVLEKFFFKRNNKKGRGTPEMLETCLLFIEYKKNVADLKFKIKDFFGGEYNPTLKKTFWETRYLSKIWKSTGFNLQKLTLTATNLCSLFEIRNSELVGNYYGEEKQGEFYELTQKMSNSDISITTSNSYIARLKNALSASINIKNWVNTEIGVSYSILLDRLWKDKTDPRRRKKKKAGFKLGEGSIQVLESVFY